MTLHSYRLDLCATQACVLVKVRVETGMQPAWKISTFPKGLRYFVPPD